MKTNILTWITLIVTYILCAIISAFTKKVSLQPIMSKTYLFRIIGVVFVMGMLAVIWQQIISNIPLSIAYMLKGLTLLFVLLIFFIFNEPITLMICTSSLLVIGNISLFSYTTI